MLVSVSINLAQQLYLFHVCRYDDDRGNGGMLVSVNTKPENQSHKKERSATARNVVRDYFVSISI